jgi:anti-anti-sigma regulatory factor
VMRLLRTEADLFRRNEQLDDQRKIYQSLAEFGKQLHGRLGEAEVAAAAVQFALYTLNLERCVIGLQRGAVARAVAWDGYYDDEQAQTIAALSLDSSHPLFDDAALRAGHRLHALPEPAGERDAIGQLFDLDEHVLFPLRDGRDNALIGYLIAGNTARKVLHHSRVRADDPVMLALENLVGLTSAALQNARLDEILAAERRELEDRVEARTRERQQLLSEVIRNQEARLEEMSTPILPIAEHILVIPLIGTMDAERSARFKVTALEGAAAQRASFVIVDITGVTAVDASFAQMLVDTAEGLRLLGVQAVFTGIRPAVAQALVSLEGRFAGLVTRGSLRGGIAFAMRRGASERVS